MSVADWLRGSRAGSVEGVGQQPEVAENVHHPGRLGGRLARAGGRDRADPPCLTELEEEPKVACAEGAPDPEPKSQVRLPRWRWRRRATRAPPVVTATIAAKDS